MGWKEISKDYLLFTRKDRIAGLAVLTLLCCIYLIPKLIGSSSQATSVVPNSILEQAVDTLQARHIKSQTFPDQEGKGNQYFLEPSLREGLANGELFKFDPNSLSADGWQRLGLSERTAKTILKYRAKGGKFYKPEDLQKIWGLPNGFYDRVESYIELNNSNAANYKTTFTPAAPYERKERNYSIADLNSADTSALIALPGIGSKLAARIITFRNKLGGFYSVEQVKETYGLPDSTFQKIKPYLQVDASLVNKLNINTATKEDLKAHPYIKWNLANAIVEYRKQHGAYTNLEQLKNIVLIDEAAYKKMAPYLTL